MTSQRVRVMQGVALVVLSACSFGAMVVFGRWAYADGVRPASVLFIRFTIAAPLLYSIVIWRGSVRPKDRSAYVSALMGVIFVGNSLSYFVALQHAPAATVAILFFSYPAIVMVASIWLFGERLTFKRVTVLALAVAGCAVTIGPTKFSALGGASLSLLAAAIYAGYVLLSRLVKPGTDAFAQAATITTVAAVLSGFIAFLEGIDLPATLLGWVGVLGLATVSTVVAIAAFLAGAARLGATGAATISSAEPVVSAMLAAMFLDEPLHIGVVLGAVMIVAATLLIVGSQPEARKKTYELPDEASG